MMTLAGFAGWRRSEIGDEGSDLSFHLSTYRTARRGFPSFHGNESTLLVEPMVLYDGLRAGGWRRVGGSA